jgi:RNA polymerase sigma-70 factor (sigma-E family)
VNDVSEGGHPEFLVYVRGRAGALRRSAYLLCGDAHQADDLVQETLIAVYSHWARVSQADNMDAYVQRILVRTFINERRRGWWKVRLFGAAAPEEAQRSAGLEEREVLRAALSRLTANQQAVLVLRYLCDRSVAEVAVLLGCSEGTVKSQTSHALTALRKILGPGKPALTLEGLR